MKYLRIIPLCLFLLIAVGLDAQNLLTGNIQNPAGTRITIEVFPCDWSTDQRRIPVQMQPNGNFAYPAKVACPSYAIFRFGKHEISLFLFPNEPLQLQFVGDQEKGYQIQFQGKTSSMHTNLLR